MKWEFEENGKRYAVFRRPYGYAVYLRNVDGSLGERVGGFTAKELKQEFPEAFN